MRQRFACESLSTVLNDWYQQPVFADLSPAERQQLIELRSANRSYSAIASDDGI